MKMIGTPESPAIIKACDFLPNMPGIWLSAKMQDVSDRYVGWATEVVHKAIAGPTHLFRVASIPGQRFVSRGVLRRQRNG